MSALHFSRWILLWTLLATMATAQPKAPIKYEITLGNLRCSLTCNRPHYLVGDTIKLSLEMQNVDSARTIYILTGFSADTLVDSVCWCIVNVGGWWYMDLGRPNVLLLRSIEPGQMISQTYRILCDSVSIAQTDQCATLTGTRDFTSDSSRYLLAYLAYYEEGPEFHGRDLIQLAREGFSEADAILLEKHLQRVLIGPLRVQIP